MHNRAKRALNVLVDNSLTYNPILLGRSGTGDQKLRVIQPPCAGDSVAHHYELLARLSPMRSGHITAPPSPATAPKATCVSASFAVFEGTVRRTTAQCGPLAQHVAFDGGNDRLLNVEDILNDATAISRHNKIDWLR